MIKRKLLARAVAALLFGAFFSGCTTGNEEPEKPAVENEGRALILQVYGTGSAVDGSISHSFAELYNPQDTALDLSGWALYYRANDPAAPDFDTAAPDGKWDKLELSGSIPAKGSYLILGKKNNESANMDLSGLAPDKTWTDKIFHNRGFSLLLRASSEAIPSAIENPANIDGEKIAGYVDLVGVYNDPDDPERDKKYVTAYETAPLGDITKQKTARRTSAVDTGDNSADFEAISFRALTNGGTKTPEQLAYYKPHTTTITWGAQGPFDPPADPVPEPPSEGLLILQAYGHGDASAPAVSHSFVELYNNSNAAINLSTYSIQYSIDGTSWTKYDLTGTIPAGGSYLILGKKNDAFTRLDLSGLTPDIAIEDMVISNDKFVIALVSKQTLITVENPFNTDGNGAKIDGYVDMVGARNGNSNTLTVFEGSGAPDIISKQKAARRKSLTDTNDNAIDFVSIDYRVVSGSNGISDEDAAKFKPRTVVQGTYTPQF